MGTRSSAVLYTLFLAVALAGFAHAQQISAQTAASNQASSQTSPAANQPPRTILRTTVRRVVLDVSVTDSNGKPISGLVKNDFTVTEDGTPQRILSFDANGFSAAMDYVPPPLPPQPPNTFINMPATPEKGPLYVLLYDLTNIDSPDQMNTPGDHQTQIVARRQMMKFIQSMPKGARFAILVRSDGLHLIQGFTSDKAKLYDAIDPYKPKPHIPTVFLNAANFGRGDRLSALDTLHSIAVFLDGLPGRKNIIWFSSEFPLSLFASETDDPGFQEETRATLELMAQNQIAIYPVDARGVAIGDSHTMMTDSLYTDTVTSPGQATPSGSSGSGGIGVGSSPSQNSTFVQGPSTVMTSLNVMDEIARETGGRAFYGTNDLAKELVAATNAGAAFYTLTYAPSNTNYDGKLRNIHVVLKNKNDQLSYRRFYYATDTPTPITPIPLHTARNAPESGPGQRQAGDSLSANMQHGAPEAHQLVFVVQAQKMGSPVEGTAAQMAELATEPAYFKTRRKSQAAKPLPPVPLQKDLFEFEIPVRQFSDEPALDLEVAAAAYDADGRIMNAFVRVTRKELEQKPGPGEPRFYRIEQELEVPVAATSVRFAVRDTLNDRIGAMEIKLPLASQGPSSIAKR